MTIGMNNAKSSAPANLVLPKATKAPKAIGKSVSVTLNVELRILILTTGSCPTGFQKSR